MSYETEAEQPKVVGAEISVSPETQLLRQSEKIASATDEELPAALLALGGAVAEIMGRDGSKVEKVEAQAALAQVGIDPSEYTGLRAQVKKNESAEVPQKTNATKKGGKGSTPAPTDGNSSVLSKTQFQQLILLAVQNALPRLAEQAAKSLKPETIISDVDVANIRQVDSRWKQIEMLATLLSKNDHRANLREGIMVDFFAHHLFKCFEEQIDDLRTAIFLTVMHEVLDAAIEAGWPSPRTSFEDFKRSFVRFCDAGAGGVYEPFTVEQARILSKHVAETFFRFFASFKFAFTQDREQDDVQDAVFVEEPLAPRPLREATPQ